MGCKSLARFSVLFLAPGFSRWVIGIFLSESALQRGFSKWLQPFAAHNGCTLAAEWINFMLIIRDPLRFRSATL